MRSFAIYDHHSRKPRAVKEGWSWQGFLFSIPYLFAKTLWLEGTLALIIFVGVRHLLYNLVWSVSLDPVAWYAALDVFQLLLILAIGIFVGMKSSDWVKERLITRGYSYWGTIEAKTFRDALQKRQEDNYALQ